LLAGVAGSLVSGQALAQDAPQAPYVSVFGAFGWPVGFTSVLIDTNDGDRFTYVTKLDNGQLFGAAIGFNLMPGAVRAEVEVARMGFNANEYFGITPGNSPPIVGVNPQGFVNAITTLANVWLTVTDGVIKTYIGGGIGIGFVTAEMEIDNQQLEQYDGTGQAFAYQFGVGALMPLGERVAVDLGYRFRGTLGGRLNSLIPGFNAEAGALGVHFGQLGIIVGY
jgi:opacity protein-like surface antigen